MWNGLDKLIELQKQDVAIAKLDAEAQVIPKAIQLLESKLVQSRATLDAARGVAEQLLKERRAKERELEEASEGVKKKQGRLFEIKTNEEYTAVLKEIAVLKEKSSNLETEILELLERSDKAAKAVTEAEQVFRAAEAVHQKERGEKEILLASLQRELDRLNELRTGQASRLEADLLRHYDRLLKSRGIALVPVKDGSCSGCGVAFPPQAFVEVRRNDRMFTCPSCSRIVYFSG
jgi:predicted  nucleic acid-binding Zn-ribbon protein